MGFARGLCDGANAGQMALGPLMSCLQWEKLTAAPEVEWLGESKAGGGAPSPNCYSKNFVGSHILMNIFMP